MTPLRRTPGKPITAANPLLEREPELVRRLSAFRSQVNDILADQLAAHQFRGRGLPTPHGPQALADVKSAAVLLRMLTKPSWDQYDLAVFDAFWRQAMSFDLLADEFEAERHRIQHCVQTARSEIVPHEPALFP